MPKLKRLQKWRVFEDQRKRTHIAYHHRVFQVAGRPVRNRLVCPFGVACNNICVIFLRYGLISRTFGYSKTIGVFEVLAFKSDVQFWSSQSSETLNKYVSVRSVIVNIGFESILLLYLWDQSANFLVLIFAICSICIECWKVTRAMKWSVYWLKGWIPLPILVQKKKMTEASSVIKDVNNNNEDYDLIAMKYLSVVVVPLVGGYAIYNLYRNCHKSVYSYVIETLASCVYIFSNHIILYHVVDTKLQ